MNRFGNFKSPSSFGRTCEEAASTFLTQRGYMILARNFRIRIGEIDIIAQKDDTVCFIEVKSGRSKKFGTPIERIGTSKRRTIIRVAQCFMGARPALARFSQRFDVITIFRDRDGEELEIRHIEDAFRA